MPTPENPQRPSEDSPGGSEKPFYCEAARFPTKPISGLAYFTIQEITFKAHDQVDLSVYRLQLENLWNVAVLGTLPPEEVKGQIDYILEKGEAVTLPEQVINALVERRKQATQLGPWVERHYRPGGAA